MTKTVLEAYKEYPKVSKDDKDNWTQFLKERYGIPYTEDTEDGEGQDQELREGSKVAGHSRASSATSRT